MYQTDSGASSHNAEYPWDQFDASNYLQRNYIVMRDDDAEILELTQSWFATALTGAEADGLDVGCGPNLYPSLAMLPVCRTITVMDYSAGNVAWLQSHHGYCDEIWRPYWELVSPSASRGEFDEARSWMAERGRVVHGSVFDLPTAQWDLGTMFFVAESITDDAAEFDRAVECFLRALRPGAPFAAAFMEESQGYDVSGIHFPAVPVGADAIEAALVHRTSELKVHRIEIRPEPLHPGYTGMLLALGRAA
jgi:SAM-dependent methyltransferase